MFDFRILQLRKPRVCKEGFSIVSTARRLEYLLGNGVHILRDSCNLAYTFNRVSSLPKIAAQIFERWNLVMREIAYSIVHTSAKRNYLGGLLLRYVQIPVISLRAVEGYARSEPDETMAHNDVICHARQQSSQKGGVGCPWS